MSERRQPKRADRPSDAVATGLGHWGVSAHTANINRATIHLCDRTQEPGYSCFSVAVGIPTDQTPSHSRKLVDEVLALGYVSTLLTWVSEESL